MDTIPAPGLSEWNHDLDEGCADLKLGRIVDGDTVLAQLDADLAAMDGRRNLGT